MKDIVGSPGTWSSVALRLSQCASAAAAVAAMDTASGYPYTAFWYLYTTMSLQLLWSFGTACLDIYSLKTKADLHDCRIVYRLLVVDWIYAILSLAAASASAGLTIFFERDVHFCRMYPDEMSCGRYKLSVILAFINCASISTSAISMFWLAVSL